MTNDIHIQIRTMRAMAWERAKGEINSMRHTFWGEDEKFKQLTKEFESFVKAVEDYDLHS